MPKFDLNQTDAVIQLCQTPQASRDATWRQKFYAAIPDASMRTLNPQILRGPDGFPYFALLLPKEGESFETFCLTHVLDACLEHGFGIVINSDKAQPDFVLNYGSLWSFKSRGTFEPSLATKASATPKREVIENEREILIGQPSEAFLPAFAREVLARFLKGHLGVAKPACFLINDFSVEPTQNLVFNIERKAFPNDQAFDQAMHKLQWFLPRDYACVSLEGEAYDQYYEPLV